MPRRASGAYVVLVTVVHGGHDLLEELSRLALLQAAVRNDEIEHLSSAGVLHDQEQHLPNKAPQCQRQNNLRGGVEHDTEGRSQEPFPFR